MSRTYSCPAIPVLAVCGWSGSGKTTLIESLIPRLQAEGLAVGVWKRDAHRLDLDREGKDTARFYRAGAISVWGEDSDQCFLRARKGGGVDITHLLRGVPLDLLLVEGHKSSPLPKIWLDGPPGSEPCPSNLEACLRQFSRSETRPDEVYDWLRPFLLSQWGKRRYRIAILVGGKSTRMGTPKALLELDGITLLERLIRNLDTESEPVVLSGEGPIAETLRGRRVILPDVSGSSSPLAGLLSLFRWDPDAAWIAVGCDLPEMNRDFIDWLLTNRSPGVWAVAPHLSAEDRLQPLAALYEPQMAFALEEAWACGERSLQRILKRDRILSPAIPQPLAASLRNLNTPEDLHDFLANTPERRSNPGT